MINREGKTLTIGKKKIVYLYKIKTVLEFDKVIVVHIAPTTQEEYERFTQEFGIKFGKGPVYAYSKEGELIWQWETRYINSITKIPHKSNLFILDTELQKKQLLLYDLHIDCQGWDFYINPETGEKIREEQKK